MRGSYRASVHDFSLMDAVLVVLETVDGRRGIGTADPSPGYSRQTPDEIQKVLSQYLPTFIRASPDDPNEATRVLDRLDGCENARCAVEMAYLDLYCRAEHRSIADFFGGRRRASEPLNAWIGVDIPERMVAEAKRWRDRGFQSLKLKLDGDADRDIQRVEVVHDAVVDEMQIRADVNGAYDVETAIEVAQALEPLDLAHLEQPVPLDDIDGLEAVTQATSIPIMADECLLGLREIKEVIDRKAADRLKVKTLRLGGLQTTHRALDLAATAGISCVVGHGFGLMPATSAELQLTASHDDVFRPVENVGMLKMADEPFNQAVTVTDGSASVGDSPGHGVELREDRLSEFVEERIDITAG
ncbi:mandelate racemase/muconate lactonizing enzyme family protein [Halomarina halobia]|uniref:Mandelate racemase/muconate lactonizing enzyme family protein n=2 Tax=Halomarina halobia TaxID=3033386 RepID=A0ABD6AEN3_9EURY